MSYIVNYERHYHPLGEIQELRKMSDSQSTNIAKNRPLFLLSLLVLMSCSKEHFKIPDHIQELENLTIYPEDPEPLNEINLHREIRYGDSDDESVGRIGAIEVDQHGRLFVSDGSRRTIHVYNPDGTYLTNLGREGSGPGEFRASPGLKSLDHLGHLYAIDTGTLQIHVFSLKSLQLSHSFNLNRAMQQNELADLASSLPGYITVIDDGKLLTMFTPPRWSDPEDPRYNLDELHNDYYLMNGDGKITSSKLFSEKSVEHMVTPVGGRNIVRNARGDSFLSMNLLDVSVRGTIISAWSKDLLINVYNSDGEYLHAFYHPYRSKLIDRNELLSMYEDEDELSRLVIYHADLPETWPVLSDMVMADDEKIWASTIIDDREVEEWWVMNKSGELLAQFTWPIERRVEVVKNGFVYARETDEMGVASIVRYRIEMEEN